MNVPRRAEPIQNAGQRRSWYRQRMEAPLGRGNDSQTVQPCPGHQVVATCDIPPGTHSRTLVKAGTVGEIVRTPAFFCTTYSLSFMVHGKKLTVHGVNRREFQIVGQGSSSLPTGFPPVKRYPQPHRVHVEADAE